MRKYYAVKAGLKIGIFGTWEECREHTYGFKGAIYKSFKTLEAAREYLSNEKIPTDPSPEALRAYIDGSYDSVSSIYSYGSVFVLNGEVIGEISGIDTKFREIRNVAGEVEAATMAVKWAIERKFKEIVICHDYTGVAQWVNGEWKAKNGCTIEYRNFMRNAAKYIEISFLKVAAHSGVEYNERADNLAKAALKNKTIDKLPPDTP
jgi:ribonuclease HI